MAVTTRSIENTEIITRFGHFSVPHTQYVFMPKGLYGFETFKEFFYIPLPEYKDLPLYLLHNVQSPAKSFLIFPADPDKIHSLYKQKDLEMVRQFFSIREESLRLGTILCFHAQEKKVSLNLHAPIIFNTEKQMAWQYIFKGKTYPVRHFIKINDA